MPMLEVVAMASSTEIMEDIIVRIVRVAEILIRAQIETASDSAELDGSEYGTDENRPQKHKSDIPL